MTILLVDRQILIGAPSSQWWTQLSSTIAGGLTFATILTLVATPAMLVIGARGDRPRANWLGMAVRKLLRRPVSA
jgi:multidrug efflux pump